MNVTCTRVIEWDAGHRVTRHEGKCKNLHGHRYRAELTAQAEQLDDLGRVVDFGVLKTTIGTWVDEHWDHKTLLWEKDPLLHLLKDLTKATSSVGLVTVLFNPTAENIALNLLKEVGPWLLHDTGVTLVRVKVWETPNCFAEAFL